MLDLSSLDVSTTAEQGTVVELLHPGTRKPLLDDNKKPYFVEVRGFDAEPVRDIETRFSNKRSENIRKNRDWGTDTETLKAEQVAKLNAATIAWYLPPLNGETLEYTHENGKRIYGDPRFVWIVEQIEEAGRDRARFFTKG